MERAEVASRAAEIERARCALDVQADLTQQKLDEAGERLAGPASGADTLKAERARLDELEPNVRDLELAEAQATARERSPCLPKPKQKASHFVAPCLKTAIAHVKNGVDCCRAGNYAIGRSDLAGRAQRRARRARVAHREGRRRRAGGRAAPRRRARAAQAPARDGAQAGDGAAGAARAQAADAARAHADGGPAHRHAGTHTTPLLL